MMFVYPKGEQLFAGTWYAPWDAASGADPNASPEQISSFLTALNGALPGLKAGPEHVAEVTAGLLPAFSPGSTELTDTDLIHDHGAHSGPRGLFSLTGIKYTTAPEVARRLLARLS
ncbi:MAG: hypothetical protein AAGH68_04790 [Pseudomonadota bacterium]